MITPPPVMPNTRTKRFVSWVPRDLHNRLKSQLILEQKLITEWLIEQIEAYLKEKGD